MTTQPLTIVLENGSVVGLIDHLLSIGWVRMTAVDAPGNADDYDGSPFADGTELIGAADSGDTWAVPCENGEIIAGYNCSQHAGWVDGRLTRVGNDYLSTAAYYID